MRLHLLEALKPGVGNLANLLRPEVFPLLTIEGKVKSGDVAHSSHVDEGVPHVARVAEVNREVQEIVRTLR